MTTFTTRQHFTTTEARTGTLNMSIDAVTAEQYTTEVTTRLAACLRKIGPPGEASEAQSYSASIKTHEEAASSELIKHAAQRLNTFDAVKKIICEHESDPITPLLEDTRDELLDVYVEAIIGRPKVASVLLRGVFEGLFTSLFYRQQAMSLNLWSSGTSFEMVHTFFNNKQHEFYKYYKRLFEDDRFKETYNIVGKDSKKPANMAFEEAERIYEILSNQVHKKSPNARNSLKSNTSRLVDDVFQIFLAFLEREEDISKIHSSAPVTYFDRVATRKNFNV